MTLGTRRLIALCIAHGIDPARIWEMTIAEFAQALEAARRRRVN